MQVRRQRRPAPDRTTFLRRRRPGRLLVVGLAALAVAGAQAHGLDVSPRMVELARDAHPDLTFDVGDLRRVLRPPAADGWAAVVAWYSLVHLAPSELPDALGGLARTLRPGGLLVMEHADSQGESLPRRMRSGGVWVEVRDHDDLSGRPRVTSARRAPRAAG